MFSYTYFEEFKMLGVCDADILGKTLHGETDVVVSESFYGKDKCDENDIKELLEKSTNINCIGNRIVELLIKMGIVDENDVAIIDGVKHAQIYKV